MQYVYSVLTLQVRSLFSRFLMPFKLQEESKKYNPLCNDKSDSAATLSVC